MIFWRVLLYGSIGWILTVIAITFAVPSEFLIDSFNQERRALVTWFGQDKAEAMVNISFERYQSWFVDSGLVQFVDDLFYTNQQQDMHNRSMQNVLNDDFFSSLNYRVDLLWIVVQSSLIRLEMLIICLILSLAFLLPTIVDGIARWQISRVGDQNASINFYTVAEDIFYILVLLPLFILVSPFAISPLFMFIWTAMLSLSLWFVISNLQHRI
jgi:hypothetical protein